MSHSSQKRKPDCSVTKENKHSLLESDISRFSVTAQCIHSAASFNTGLWVCCSCSDTHCCADCPPLQPQSSHSTLSAHRTRSL